MKTSHKGLDLMHKFEGYKNKPYLCPAHIHTVGWGTVLYQEQIRLPVVRKEGYTGIIRKEMPLKEGDNRVWTKEELVTLFKNDLAAFERAVLRLVPSSAGSQGRFDALVCLAYNIGSGNLQRSTIRMRANRGDWGGAADAFRMWVKGGGKVLPGLVRRREAEIALFLSGD